MNADDQGWADGTSDGKDLNGPHELFPFWSRAQTYNTVTAMFLDCMDDAEIARDLASRLNLALTPSHISKIRTEAALAAERQPHDVKRRWIYRYRRLTVNNLVKEYMFMEGKQDFLKAKRELAEEITLLVSATPAAKICVAINDALGRNNVSLEIIHELEAYGLTARKMEDAAKRHAQARGISLPGAMKEIVARATDLYNGPCLKDLEKTAQSVALFLSVSPSAIDRDDVTLLLDHNRYADDEKSTAENFKAKIEQGADIMSRPRSTLEQALEGAAYHMSHKDLLALVDTIRSSPVMGKADLWQVLQYTVRHIRDIGTRKELGIEHKLPEQLQEVEMRALTELRGLLKRHLLLVDHKTFFTAREISRAARNGISENDLQTLLDRLNGLATGDEVQKLLSQVLDERRFRFPSERYLDMRFSLFK